MHMLVIERSVGNAVLATVSGRIALKSSQAQGKAFGLAALQPLLLDIFAVSRFNIVFQLFSTVREAFSKLAPFALEELDRR